MVLELVSEKFGTGKKHLRTGIGKIWYRKKVLELVSENFGTKKVTVPVSGIFGTRKRIGIVQHYGYRHTLLRTKLTVLKKVVWINMEFVSSMNSILSGCDNIAGGNGKSDL